MSLPLISRHFEQHLLLRYPTNVLAKFTLDPCGFGALRNSLPTFPASLANCLTFLKRNNSRLWSSKGAVSSHRHCIKTSVSDPLATLTSSIPGHAAGTCQRLSSDKNTAMSKNRSRSGFQQRFMKEKHFVAVDRVPVIRNFHWHVFNGSFYYTHAPIEWFWQHTIPGSSDGHTMRTFSVETQLVHSSAHFVLQAR